MRYCYFSVFVLFSPTHKRTEGRAPVWGSEFTTKVALQGVSTETAAGLNYIIIWDLAGWLPAWCQPPFWGS